MHGPLETLQSFVKNDPAHSRAQSFFAKSAPELLLRTPEVVALQMAPFGNVAAVYPVASPRLNLSGIISGGGLDLFNASNGKINHRDISAFTLQLGLATAQGPRSIFACSSSVCSTTASSTLALVIRASPSSLTPPPPPRG